MSWGITSAGMFTVLLIAPERNGWAAAIIVTWACQGILRTPFAALKAQSNTGRCSSSTWGEPSIVSFSSMYATISSIWVASYPSFSSPALTVRLIILSIPPPASCLYFTSAMSGSIPVVSQSIMKLIVPVGASTVAWALRKPYFSPIRSTSSHSSRAAPFNASGPSSSIASHASRCIRITLSIGFSFSA